MTTRKLSSEKLLDISLLKNTTRRRLPHILVAFLVSFFTVSVPIMMTFDDYLEDWRGAVGVTVERMIELAKNDVSSIMTINLVFTYALAVYFGIITLGFMMKRRSAHFYHALPQRRETLYITSVVSSLLCAAVGAAVNLIIAAVELAVFDVGYAEVFETFFTLVFNNLLVFLSVYAITVFAGTISGNRVVQMLMTLVIMLYPLATYMGLLLVRESHASYFMPDYFVTDSIIQWLSPFTHVGVNYQNAEISPLTTALALVASVLLLLGGLAIYKKRAIENSERPIVFKKLGSVLKYMFMFTVTIFAGMFFYTIEYNDISLIFGCISGAVLSFMLFNTILEKTPKAMFKNIKGLCIFAAAFAVYMVIFGFDVFKLDNYIPDSKDITYAEISLDHSEYDDNRFDDPEMLEALVTMLENQQEFNENKYASPFESYKSSFNVEVVMHTKFGLPVSRRYYVTKYVDGVDEFLELYANDERMQNAFDKRMSQLTEHIGKDCTADVHIQLDGYRSVICPLDEILSIYLGEVSEMNYDTLSKPVVGYFSVNNIYDGGKGTVYNIYDDRGDASVFDDLPVYEDMTDTVTYLKFIDGGLKESAEAVNEESRMIGGEIYDIREPVQCYDPTVAIRRGFAYDLGMYPSKEIDAETAEMIAVLVSRYNSNQPGITSLFMALDEDFVAKIRYSTDAQIAQYDDVYYEKYYGDAEVKLVQETQFGTSILVFPRGMVPEAVKALFN